MLDTGSAPQGCKLLFQGTAGPCCSRYLSFMLQLSRDRFISVLLTSGALVFAHLVLLAYISLPRALFSYCRQFRPFGFNRSPGFLPGDKRKRKLPPGREGKGAECLALAKRALRANSGGGERQPFRISLFFIAGDRVEGRGAKASQPDPGSQLPEDNGISPASSRASNAQPGAPLLRPNPPPSLES